jgi:hypothetical protein
MPTKVNGRMLNQICILSFCAKTSKLSNVPSLGRKDEYFCCSAKLWEPEHQINAEVITRKWSNIIQILSQSSNICQWNWIRWPSRGKIKTWSNYLWKFKGSKSQSYQKTLYNSQITKQVTHKMESEPRKIRSILSSLNLNLMNLDSPILAHQQVTCGMS